MNFRRNFRLSFVLLVFSAVLPLGFAGIVHAQGDLGDLEALIPPGGDGGGGGGAGGFGGGADQVDIQTSENTRNQGFVGPTAPGISAEPQDGFVGAVSEQSGPPLAAGSFGGGVNNVTPPTFSGANTGGGGGEMNGFTVNRRSVRARLRPSFYAPRAPSAVVTSRFQNHYSRQPGSQSTGGQYSIAVNNRTAYIRGWVNNAADSQRLERQLRLEPGVYRIVNELSYGNGN